MPYSRRRQTEIRRYGHGVSSKDFCTGCRAPSKGYGMIQRTSFAGPLQHEGGLVAVMAAPRQRAERSLAFLVQQWLLAAVIRVATCIAFP